MKRFDSRSSGLVSLLLAIAMGLIAAIVLVVVAVVALVLGALSNPSSLMNALDHGKTIDVVVYNGDKRTEHYLPALDGASAGFSGGYGYSMPGQSVHVQTDENYKVVANPKGHFTVMIHRVIEQNGSKSTTNGALQVFDSEPAADKRLKLPDGSAIAAYLTKDSH